MGINSEGYTQERARSDKAAEREKNAYYPFANSITNLSVMSYFPSNWKVILVHFFRQ